jgi:hypothetical protein
MRKAKRNKRNLGVIVGNIGRGFGLVNVTLTKRGAINHSALLGHILAIQTKTQVLTRKKMIRK